MGKRKATYDLEAFEASREQSGPPECHGRRHQGAPAMGFGRADIVSTILTMRRSHFFKSMTSHADHRVCQDMHHAPSRAGLLYVKFTADAVTEFLLLSFKEKDND